MSKKIIGVTVGTTLPKPNFKQTDPTKGDYIRNKPDFEGLKTKVDAISDLVGDSHVVDQISDALSSYPAVLHTEQELTPEQQSQARTNIGAAGVQDVEDALATKSDVDHTHENVVLYDTISAVETLRVEYASPEVHDLSVTLSSDTYTGFSSITVTLTSDNGTQTAVSNVNGNVIGLHSEPSFTLTLKSSIPDFDLTKITITCGFQIDLDKTLQNFVLNVDDRLEDSDVDYGDTSVVASSVVIDKSLSIAGAVADSKAVGDAIAGIKILDTDETLTLDGAAADAKVTGTEIQNLKDLVGNMSVAEQIALAYIDEIYVQDTEPEDVPDGSVWVDTSTEELQPGAAAGIGAPVYVEDAATTDASTIDFSKYSVGDVILVTVS